jgi:hypothetical protein
VHTTVTPFAARRENGAATVTDAVALTEPDVAVIVTVPFATAVTSPVDDTVATAASDVAHVTVALLIAAPFWSLTVADSWDVSPSVARLERLRLAIVRVIEVATGVGVGAVGLPSYPPQLAKDSDTNRALNTNNFFMPPLCSAPLRPATQDPQNTAG